MDHNKKPTVSTGHEVYLCHRCGWPFPNPHPSSRHRRAHKKICGTVEGYEIFESRSDDHQVSDDEHNSDENEHTPSPKVEKRSAKELGSSGGVGGRSNKSEEDVFSDAISEFSDSGISPKLGERFEREKGMDMIMEQEIVKGDLTGIELKKVDEAADQMEQLSIPASSDQNCNPAPLANAPGPSESVLSMTDTKVGSVPVEDSNALQPNLIKSEILMDRVDEYGDKEVQQETVKTGQDTDIPREDDKFASVVLDTEEGKTLGPASVSEAIKHDDPSPYSQVFQFQGPASVPVEEGDVLCDKLVAEVVEHDQSPITETLEDMDATAEAEGGAISAEVNESTGTIDDIALVDEASEQIVGVTDDSNSAKVVECTGSIDENSLAEESVQTSAATDSTETGCSDAVAVVSSIEKEVEQKTSLSGSENAGELNPNEGENCDIVGSENKSQELEENISGEVFADTSIAPGNDQTMSVLKEDNNQNSDKVLASVVQSVNSTVVPSSCQVDTDAEHLEVSKTEADLLESTDNGLQKSLQEFGADTDTKVLLEVGSTGLDAGLDHDTNDALDKNSQTTTSEEPVNSDLRHNNHVTTDAKQVEHTDVSEMASEFKHNGDVIAPESTPEPPISEDSAPLFKDDNENTGTSLSNRASESVEAAEVTTEPNHNGDVILSKSSESTTLEKQEALPPSQECLKETSPEGHTSKDADSSKSVDIAPAAEQTCDNNAALSEKHPNASNLNEPVSLPIVLQAIDESSATANEGDVKLTKEKDGGSAMDLSGSYVSRSDSLEAKCGSVSDKSETNLQAPKTTTEEAFEAPSFMTLVQSDNKVDDQSSEIETVKNNQHPKADALQAGWFPSLTNVVNESEGRKKNEEIIAKVTEWNQGKQHGPLKNLLNEAKSPNTKQVPPANQKDEVKDNGAAVTTVGSVLGNDNKEAEKEWDSPARYPTEIKKEKKKGKAYWVPFVCCSSVHRDL